MKSHDGHKPTRYWKLNGFTKPMSLADLPPETDSMWEAHYNNDCESGKRTTRVLRPPWHEAITRCLSSRFLEELCEVSAHCLHIDPTKHGAGLHVTEPGGWLNCHLDYDVHPERPGFRRALSLVCFLNETWEPEWGGFLQLCDPMGEPMVTFKPTPGQLVIWENTELAYHRVTKVLGPYPRITTAVYLLERCNEYHTRKRALFMPNRSKQEHGDRD
jgi:hypothetical protein